VEVEDEATRTSKFVDTPQQGQIQDMDEAVHVIEEHQEFKKLELQEALAKWDVVDVHYDPVHGSYVLMAERDPKIEKGFAISEMGSSYPSPWTAWTREERVTELRDRLGLRKYYDMKRADGTVRGALRALKTPILSARWFVEPHSHEGEKEPSALDKNIARFVVENLFQNLNVPWSRVVEDALLMCEYGYMVMEKVFEEKNNKIYLKKLAPRHPLDVKEWIYDANGGPEAVVMEATESSGFEGIEIPIEKLVVFVLEQEGGDLRGISVLRSAYKHYYYKDTLYKIDAIQKERHGIGVPIIKLPMGYTDGDRKLADELGRNLRTNERAHITVPMNWEVAFAKLEGQPVNCLDSIEHHDRKIMTNILAPFMDDPNAKPDSTDMFLKSTRYIANTIADTVTKYVIPQLVDFNFARGMYPHLHARRIGEWEDMRTMSFTLRNLVGAKLVIPDERLEEQLRRELDMPAIDHNTMREVDTPQFTSNAAEDLPEADLPRQKSAPPVGPAAKNAGLDRSGGAK
jgi:hypothetical protein